MTTKILSQNSSKVKRRQRRTRCNLPRKSINCAEMVTRRTTTDALFAQGVA